jgi:hypothetical protein
MRQYNVVSVGSRLQARYPRNRVPIDAKRKGVLLLLSVHARPEAYPPTEPRVHSIPWAIFLEVKRPSIQRRD